MSKLGDLVSTREFPGDLAALLVVLVEHGVPLVVAAREQEHAAGLRRAFTSEVLAEQPARDAVAGGVVIGQSLEDVLRVLGAARRPRAGRRVGAPDVNLRIDDVHPVAPSG